MKTAKANATSACHPERSKYHNMVFAKSNPTQGRANGNAVWDLGGRTNEK
jgi:hypothetical protein